MMKINNKKINKKYLVIAGVAVVMVSGLLFAWWYTSQNDMPSNKELTEAVDKTSSVQPEQIEDSSTEASSRSDDASAKLPEKSPNDQTTDTSGANPPAGFQPEQPNVSRAGVSGEYVKVVAMFNEESPGYCELQLSKPGQQAVNTTSNITVGPSYYVCSLRVNTSSLATGTWQVVVIHHVGNTSTKSETAAVQVR